MISVVTPSFRQLDWLRLCVASVADQGGAVEHIVQDAGSEGVQQALADSPVRLFVEQDEGMYDAINRGLGRAAGEICAYLNCDEQYLPHTLAKVAAFFEANPETDLLFGDFIVVDERGYPFSYRRVVQPTADHIRFAHLNTASCAMFFRRRLVENGHRFDTTWKTIGDAVWVKSLLDKNVRMEVLHEPLAVFTFTGENLGASELSRREMSHLSAGVRLRRLRRAASIFSHRLRKLRAGAYRKRRLEIDIYTLASPEQRVPFEAEVGHSWPVA